MPFVFVAALVASNGKRRTAIENGDEYGMIEKCFDAPTEFGPFGLVGRAVEAWSIVCGVPSQSTLR